MATGIICHSCINWKAYTTPLPARGLIIGCTVLKIRFGNERDFMAGKFQGNAAEKRNSNAVDMPKKCLKYVAKEFKV